MKAAYEKKLKEILERYVESETARSEIVSVVDDIVDDEKYDAKNDGYYEGLRTGHDSIY